METLSYEKRIELGNLVPALGQFKVMEKIPQYQQCEVHNLVEAPAEVPETLRHVVFNIERGQTLHETIDFLNMCPDLKNMDIIYANELDDGAVRSGNCNVAYEIAKSIGMNYAYGLEFIELVNPDPPLFFKFLFITPLSITNHHYNCQNEKSQNQHNNYVLIKFFI